MAFFEQTVTIGGVVYWPIESVPVETDRDLRGYDTDVTAALADGSAVTLRDASPGSGQAILPQPLKSSPQNGFVPALLASQPMFFYNSSIGSVLVVSPAWRNLQVDLDEALARAAAAEEAALVSSNAALSAAEDALQARTDVTNFIADGGGSGGSGNDYGDFPTLEAAHLAVPAPGPGEVGGLFTVGAT